MEIRIPLNNTLREGSRNYYENVLAYKIWNDCHDTEKKIAKYLKIQLKGKEVLDIGCGNGKYAKLLAPHVFGYVGIDISDPQLKLAQSIDYGHNNTLFFHRNAEHTRFSSDQFDAIISVWGALSVVKDLRRKTKILKEIERLLKPNGVIYIVRDDFGGEWVDIKRRQKSHRGYDWLLKNGFTVTKRITTSFDFESPEYAKMVMHSLFGRKVSAFIKKAHIEHKIMILKKVKKG